MSGGGPGYQIVEHGAVILLDSNVECGRWVATSVSLVDWEVEV
jgi:hypothetical protein